MRCVLLWILEVLEVPEVMRNCCFVTERCRGAKIRVYGRFLVTVPHLLKISESQLAIALRGTFMIGIWMKATLLLIKKF